jgi:hypothetical protein
MFLSGINKYIKTLFETHHLFLLYSTTVLAFLSANTFLFFLSVNFDKKKVLVHFAGISIYCIKETSHETRQTGYLQDTAIDK